MNAIETHNLSKAYGKARGIIDVNLEVHQGEIFGFIGPNGAGKSTTIRILLNFLWPSAGSASVFSMDCAKEGARIKRRVGYLPSEVNYYDNMRVGELLSYSASFYDGDFSERIAELAARLDLDPTKRIDELSYGNKKKVGIVQALLHKPDLLILDEPTGGLDPLMQHRFFELLLEEKARGATIFFSSHVLSEVERLCDRVAIIKEGRLLRVEGVAELRANRYKKVRVELASGGHDALRGLLGANSFQRDGNSIEFLYAGRLGELISALGGLSIDNLSIEEPSLEEIVMRYYEEEPK